MRRIFPATRYHARTRASHRCKLLGNADALANLPPPSSVAGRSTLRGARRNAQSVVRVPLQSNLGGPYGALAYGFRTALDVPGATP